MTSSNARNITTGVLIVLVVVAVASALFRPTSEVTVQSGEVVGIEQATADDALVTSISEQGGFRFLGITFSSPTRWVQVTFTAPPGCLDVIVAADTWPTGDVACGADGGMAGEISGSGRTAEGLAIVSVRFEVTPECYEAISVGEEWATHPECREL